MAANEKHIEGFVGHNTHHESKLVEQNSHTNGYREYRHTAQDGLVTRLDRSRVIQKHPHHDHGRMTYHALYVDPNADRKNVFGIDHHTRACKEGKGGKIIQQCALQLAARHSRQKPDVHGRGAELPREDIPLIIKLHTAVVRKAIIDLLVNLQHDDKHCRVKYHVHGVFDLAMLIKQAQQHGYPYRQKQPQNMKPTIRGRVCHVSTGLALSCLRAAGNGLGWGFQMQYPPFVLFLAVLLFVTGLLFSGVFTVGSAVSNTAGRIGSDWGGFGTGLLAVLAATPCAAPFMGVALGYALLAPPAETLAVFFVMGIGMSVPFSGIAFFPAFAAKLPKSGAWCETLRQFLAFPLYMTTAWLVWVLTVQAGEYALGVALALLCLTAACAWFLGKFPENKKVAATGVLIFFCALSGAMYAVTPVKDAERAVVSARWKPYDADEIARLRRERVPVFVKFSASWCLTCLMNEKTTLETDKITELFEEKGVALFSADWTNRNDGVTAVLESFRRGGVPLYLYYAPSAQTPVVLPQILTPSGIETLLRDL